MKFSPSCVLYTLNGNSQKLVNQKTYFASNNSSLESDGSIHIKKIQTANDHMEI